jgi:N-acetylglutamate synthase-like GNAT family acetyltransferase
MDVTVRPAQKADRDAVRRALSAAWGGTIVVGHGVRYDAATLPALIAERDGELVGVLTYVIEDDAMEVVTIDSTVPQSGAGSALLAAAGRTARAAGVGRLWLVTTNDNLDALRFYQRRGLRLVGLASDAVAASRVLKPSIPEIGAYGIPIRDELTLEMRF